jgi:basic membrane protein A
MSALRLLALLTVGVGSVVGCAGSDEPDTGSAPAPATDAVAVTGTGASGPDLATTTLPAEEPFLVTLVAPSAVDDASFTQSMVDALERLTAAPPAGVGALEYAVAPGLPDPDDALVAARQFVADGADVVVVHGSQYRAVVDQLAAEFPDVSLAWGTEADDLGRSNVFTYSARADEGGYVNGVIAAGITSSGMVGAIGPIDIGDAGLYVRGFQAGAASVDPAITVSVNFIDSYTDAGLAREAATVMTQFGADVLTGTSQIVSGPLELVAAEGIPWLATQSSPVSLAPDDVVATQVYHWEVALREMLDVLAAGGTGGTLAPLTLANGGLVVERNPAYELPPAVSDRADAAIAGLTDGSLTTGAG